MANEKRLIELLSQAQDNGIIQGNHVTHIAHISNKTVADYLIANGVTVQKWIPVTERLPENGETVICVLKRGECWVATWNEFDDNLWSDGENWCSNSEVTHWMPLPEPPKGE